MIVSIVLIDDLIFLCSFLAAVDVLCGLKTGYESWAELCTETLPEEIAEFGSSDEVGLVGATGSFESLSPLDEAFPKFSNIRRI